MGQMLMIFDFARVTMCDVADHTTRRCDVICCNNFVS